MKAKPVRIVQGLGYVQCSPNEASHVMLEVPGPTGHLTLPVILKGKREGTGCWTWNGSTDAPTLRPSVLTNGTYRLTDEEHATLMAGDKVEPRRFRCHSWINDGVVQFLDDCSHELANTSVPLLDVPPDESAGGVETWRDPDVCPQYKDPECPGACDDADGAKGGDDAGQ
jgi:hypothetical protein